MTPRERLTEVVEAEGHLIDSQLLNVIFDTVIKWNAAFEVLEFRIGRTNEEPSFISMRITGPDESALNQVLEGLVALGCRISTSREVTLVRADKDGCVPNDFSSVPFSISQSFTLVSSEHEGLARAVGVPQRLDLSQILRRRIIPGITFDVIA